MPDSSWAPAMASREKQSHSPARQRSVPLWLLTTMTMIVPLLCAAISVLGGREAGWDLRNYHWYNPYAFLQQRLGFDLAVGHHSTYYNPLSDLPLHLIATHAPGWVGGLYLGALHGLALGLIGLLAWQWSSNAEAQGLLTRRERTGLCFMLMLSAAAGGGAISMLGSTSNDVAAAVGSLAALSILLNQQGRAQTSIVLLGCAGLLAGLAAGLKLTHAIYAVGVCAATFTVDRGTRRLPPPIIVAAGCAVGFLLTAGYWMWQMWQFSGNPFFPYFNELFKSPLLFDANYRDPTFIPDNWSDRLLFPFLIVADSRFASELVFRDAKLPLAYGLAPLALYALWRHRWIRNAVPVEAQASGTARLLLIFAAVSYVLWMPLFSIYRYLVPLEMLAPLLVAALLWVLPLSVTARVAMLCLSLLSCALVVKWDRERYEWGGWTAPYVQIEGTPRVDVDAMVLMAGTSPTAFVIPAFPPQVPFLRIDGWLTESNSSNGLTRRMRERVAQHRGPLSMLYTPKEYARALKAARDYELSLSEDCEWVRSNVAEPLRLCPLLREQSSSKKEASRDAAKDLL